MVETVTLDERSREAPWDEMIGRAAGSFRIVKLLGKGGMGSVYLARHPGIGSEVAVKFLHPRFSGDRQHVDRFFNEARAVNLIGHENIVKTLDFSVTADGRYYFVMELLNGQSLASLLHAPVPLAVAGPVLLQCCRALQAAHERQIVHRDLKPDNIFLISQMGKKNFVKLVDFGIAKLVDPAQAGLTEAGALIGTPEYMSPEQAAGKSAEVGRRSDVYSLGVVMYQLATGRVPFRGASTAETLVMHMQEEPEPPRTYEPSVPEAYERIILKALEKKKDDRWQSMGELHDAIAACMKDLAIPIELPPADPEPAPRPPALMPPTDPKSPREVPLTGTYAGDKAPLQARVERFADWALAPARRLRTLAIFVAGLIAIFLLLPSRQPPAPQPALVVHPATPTRPAEIVSKPVEPPPPPVPEKKAEPPPPKPVQKPKPKPKHVVPPPITPQGPTAVTAAEAARSHAAEKARAEMIGAAAQAAKEDASLPRLPGGVRLFIVSNPLQASVTAAWNGKSAAGSTPIVFKVRRGATVTVSISKQGFAPEVREVVAKEAQAINFDLRATQ